MAKATKKEEPGTGKTSFNLPVSLLEDLRGISFKDRKSQTEIVIEALEEYKTKWISKNGKIPK